MTEQANSAEATFREGFNCAQAVLSTYSQRLGLDRATALKIATGFGGKTQQDARQETARRTIERPEFGLEELGDINIPAFLRNRM